MDKTGFRQRYGYDSNPPILGDLLRGERVSAGKTLADVENDLCIRAQYIEAIEAHDVTSLPDRAFLSGYLRSYARYLGLDPDKTLRAYLSCHFKALTTKEDTKQPDRNSVDTVSSHYTSANGHSSPQRQNSFFLKAPINNNRSPSSLAFANFLSTGLLLLISAGVIIGGILTIRNIQKVALTDEYSAGITRNVILDADPYGTPDKDAFAVSRGRLSVAPPDIAQQDGPLGNIAPKKYGVFTPTSSELQTEKPNLAISEETSKLDRPASPAATQADDPAAHKQIDAVTEAASPNLNTVPTAPAALVYEPITLVAAERTWIRITRKDGEVIFSGILGAGDRYSVSESVYGSTLRVGNAGGLYFEIGEKRFGPLGGRQIVIDSIPLDATHIRNRFSVMIIGAVQY